ncbi:SusC/RagA family TonB-linked outer membrane protein [Flavobacterium sp. NKUCC04_CG]|uniref:SusC/RagA family TonB-linked outer membrane protein n=1 Tax=Flavobacterium sp. NKUCC04_CG TaxID=2842121 RepID=UPI001C5BD20F|nr:SusC/RagA family TonB-linked outer membrane protein [Flavobacterium sp. NKUCC04_CG]MBW3518109.1 SusC/RagA family TonB-linked outer membrane protein [Flavobacterium sp. NKUCC04_CG]
MKKTLLIFTLLLFSMSYAQEKRTITGFVQDAADKLSLPGASVVVETQSVSNSTDQKGVIQSTSIGTVTDIDGNFSLEIPKSVKAIRISYMGYDSRLINLTPKSHYIVGLSTDSNMMTEVVVTGYQTIEKRKLTSAVGQVSMEDIKQVGVASVDQLLSGQIAGVAVSTPTGAPGAPAKIRIRGTASLSGPQDPLWVVDGMPLEGNDIPNFNDKENLDQLQNFSIAGLNPDDILDITILKDAAATAIYGARAANGVISITTKRGKKGDMKVNFTANTFITQKPDFSKLNLMNANEKVDFELMLAGRSDLNYRTDKGEISRILNASGELELFRQNGFGSLSPTTQQNINNLRRNQTDWGDAIYQTAINKQYGLSLSGGGDRSDYYFSLGYYDEEGATIGTGFERYNLTLKNNFQVSDKLKVGVGLFGTQVNKKSYVSDTDAAINPSNYSRNVNPYLTPYNADGSFNYDKDIDGYSDRYIPFNLFEERENTSYDLKNNALKAIIDVNYDITDDLKFTSQLGLQLDNNDTEKYTGKESYFTRKEREKTRRYKDGGYYYFLPEGGIIQNWKQDFFQYNWKTQLTYNTIIKDLHEIDVMAGTEIRKTDSKLLMTKGFGYDPKTLTTKPIMFPNEEISREKEYESYKKTHLENSFASFFATAAYTYDRKYTFFGSVRYDGSNLFGVDPKYKYLPLWSASASWLVSNEKFMEDLTFVSNLRLRASYGLQGNIDKNTSPFVVGEYKQVSILPGHSETNIQVLNPPNNKLRWEKTTNSNFGFDLGMFQNRVSVAVDVYDRNSTDLIGLRELPLENGFEFTNMNWAQISNKGYEISISTRNIDRPNFKWSTNFNFAHNKSKIDRVETRNSSFLPSGQGNAINAVYGLKTAGLDEHGNILFWKDGEKVGAKDFFQLYDAFEEIMPGEFSKSNLTNEEFRNLFTVIGDKDPKFTGGIINNFVINNFDINISAAFNIKQTVVRNPPYNSALIDRGQNYTTDVLNAWSPSNPQGNLPAISSPTSGNEDDWMAHQWFAISDVSNSYKYLDIWAKEMSYIRISSIRLGYTFPKALTDALKIQNARISLEGRNLLVFGTDYSGYFDPETYGSIYAQPISKSFTIGLNFTF